LDRVRAIGHDSAFRHWRMFVKGVVAFHRGDRAKAARCFRESPADSVPAKAAIGYAALAGDAAAQVRPWTETELQKVCAVMGLPELAPALTTAERHWQSGNHVASYEVLRRAMPEFPAEGPSALGVLTAFYFKSVRSLSHEDSYEFIGLFARYDEHRQARSDTERALSLRALCLNEGIEVSSGMLDQKWRLFVSLLNRLHRPDAERDALALTWLGQQFAQETAAPGPFAFGRVEPQMRDATRAIDALEEAITLDAANLEAHLALCSVYERLKRPSDRNRLLDAMTKRFPERKEVLVRAGLLCLERKAFTKGLDYLERARELDRLDPLIPESIVRARTHIALQAFEKQRLDQARKVLDAIEEFVVDRPDDLVRARWAVRTRRGLLETLFGGVAAGKALLDAARRESPAPEAFLLLAHIEQRDLLSAATSPWLAELESGMAQTATVDRAFLLYLMVRDLVRARGVGQSERELAFLREYLLRAAKKPFSRDEVVRILDCISVEIAQACDFRPLVDPLQKQDSADPLLRVYAVALDFGGKYLNRPAVAVAELKSVLEEARRRGDQKTIKVVQPMIQNWEERRIPTEGPWDDGIEVENDDEYEDEDEDESADGGGFDPFANVPERHAAALYELVSTLSTASPGQIKHLKQNLPPGVPREMIDMFIDLARSGMPLPKLDGPLPLPQTALPKLSESVPKPRSPPAQPKPQTPPDPSQIELRF
jgi:tetratricopeptide (TPR) repeat protein